MTNLFELSHCSKYPKQTGKFFTCHFQGLANSQNTFTFREKTDVLNFIWGKFKFYDTERKSVILRASFYYIEKNEVLNM